jgi:hypothetical protein
MKQVYESERRKQYVTVCPTRSVECLPVRFPRLFCSRPGGSDSPDERYNAGRSSNDGRWVMAR